MRKFLMLAAMVGGLTLFGMAGTANAHDGCGPYYGGGYYGGGYYGGYGYGGPGVPRSTSVTAGLASITVTPNSQRTLLSRITIAIATMDSAGMAAGTVGVIVPHEFSRN